MTTCNQNKKQTKVKHKWTITEYGDGGLVKTKHNPMCVMHKSYNIVMTMSFYKVKLKGGK